MIEATRKWWNKKIGNKERIMISRKLGWADTFRVWGQLESWEQTALISYWLKG